MINSPRLAKLAMKLWERAPDPDDLALAEIFQQDVFLKADDARKREIMLASARFRYEYEKQFPFSRYFSVGLEPFFAGKEVLDLGCFTGGRSVAWYETYGMGKIYGVDVAPEFIEASREFAALHGADAEFRLAFGEDLPFEDESFDAVATFDVFEHVADLSAVMAETYRVLRPGGALVVVFPQFLNPVEHHLGNVTGMPAVHWVFSPDAINQAYLSIIRERAEAGAWYMREFQPWERLPSINGTSMREFDRIVAEQPWEVVHRDLMVVLTTTRPIMARPALRRVLNGLRPLLRIPPVRELLADRIAVVLQKPAG